jgi:hypothetical protein
MLTQLTMSCFLNYASPLPAEFLKLFGKYPVRISAKNLLSWLRVFLIFSISPAKKIFYEHVVKHYLQLIIK